VPGELHAWRPRGPHALASLPAASSPLCAAVALGEERLLLLCCAGGSLRAFAGAEGALPQVARAQLPSPPTALVACSVSHGCACPYRGS
jgi:hypothetical protein